MFNIFNSVKKIIGIKKNPDSPTANQDIKTDLTNKLSQFSSFVSKKINEAIEEYHVIRKKMQNLYQTNYDLGMRHLERGNLSEAVFRFRIIKKFWPDKYEAYYQLAYCLILLKKPHKAKIVIDELLMKNPDYKSKVAELLNSIEAEEKNSEDA